METFQHGVRPEWEYAAPQEDTFVEHNRMAEKVMKEAGVPVADFYALLVNKRNLAKGDRFQRIGLAYKVLCKQTADSIVVALTLDSKVKHPK